MWLPFLYGLKHLKFCVSSARERISSATTAKALPASPARAASIEALIIVFCIIFSQNSIDVDKEVCENYRKK